MTPLEKNLRVMADAPGHASKICLEAADRISALEGALRPFAEAGLKSRKEPYEPWEICEDHDIFARAADLMSAAEAAG